MADKKRDRWFTLPVDNIRKNGRPEMMEVYVGDKCLLSVSEDDEKFEGVEQDIIDELDFACKAANMHDKFVEALEPFAKSADLQPAPDGTDIEWCKFESRLKNCLDALKQAKIVFSEAKDGE